MWEKVLFWHIQVSSQKEGLLWPMNGQCLRKMSFKIVLKIPPTASRWMVSVRVFAAERKTQSGLLIVRRKTCFKVETEENKEKHREDKGTSWGSSDQTKVVILKSDPETKAMQKICVHEHFPPFIPEDNCLKSVEKVLGNVQRWCWGFSQKLDPKEVNQWGAASSVCAVHTVQPKRRRCTKSCRRCKVN